MPHQIRVQIEHIMVLKVAVASMKSKSSSFCIKQIAAQKLMKKRIYSVSPPPPPPCFNDPKLQFICCYTARYYVRK